MLAVVMTVFMLRQGQIQCHALSKFSVIQHLPGTFVIPFMHFAMMVSPGCSCCDYTNTCNYSN